MRPNARWFRAQAPKRPEVVGATLAVAAWNAARGLVQGLRRDDFDIPAGPAYFRILAEALAFEIQVAWRAIHARYDEGGRAAFVQALAREAARILADNESELLRLESAEAIGRRFIAELNARFEDYAGFGCDRGAPDFAFLRFLAARIEAALPAADRPWVHDAVMMIEGPRAADRLVASLEALLDTGPRRTRRATLATGVE